MAKDVRRITDFRRSAQYIDELFSLFESAGFSIEFVYDQEEDNRSWGARITPTNEMAQDLGSHNQMLLWVDNFDKFQARSLQTIDQQLKNVRPILREDIAFLVSNDPNVSEAVAALPSENTIVALSFTKLKEFSAPSGPDFKRHLLSRVFSRDPYQLTGAVVHQWQFFGRNHLIAELIASVNAGHKIGLFGLRKIGKTSVLLRLIDQLPRSNSSIAIAHLQVARVDAVRRSSDYFLWSLGQSMFHGLPPRFRSVPFRLLGRFGVFSDLPTCENIPDLLYHDLSQIFSRTNAQVCLVFDEIERMWPSSRDPETSQWHSEFPRIWQLLRSIDQEFPSRIAIVVAGTSPECIECRRVGEYDNPLFQYIQVRYLPFLEREDATLLLNQLGSRVGLNWDSDACRLAYEQVSGHPALLRVLGTAVYTQGRNHDRRRIIYQSIVEDASAATARGSNPILNEICGAIKEGYPDDFLLLELLAQNRLGEYHEYSTAFPDAVQHLQGYGLVVPKPPAISFSLLQTHLQGLLRAKLAPPTTGLQPATVDSYSIVGTLGRVGGFGRVYRAMDSRGQGCAIKILHSSSISSLSRETDILRELRHNNIVRFVDSGHDPSAGNYIVMEHLEGKSWLDFCTRATRLRHPDVRNKIECILKALQYIHPKPSPFVSDSRDVSVQDILARSIGYVHRDIKPENIIEVPRRGPVLIDFGISSKTGDPTKTLSATPGYLPPDFLTGNWDADVDLYQAGLTFLQVLVGDVYTGDSGRLDDLRELLDRDPELPRQLKQCVLRLCAPEKGKRFRTAQEALRALPHR